MYASKMKLRWTKVDFGKISVECISNYNVVVASFTCRSMIEN
jgi:hypothetical protein